MFVSVPFVPYTLILPTSEQRNADIAADSLGSFVVVWSSYAQDGSSNFTSHVQYSTYTTAGDELGVALGVDCTRTPRIGPADRSLANTS